MKKSFEELSQLLKDAKSQVKVGSTYAHYKNRNNTYNIEGFIIIQETNEVGVLYRALYSNEDVVFMRPLKEFLEDVEWEGNMVKRFELVR